MVDLIINILFIIFSLVGYIALLVSVCMIPLSLYKGAKHNNWTYGKRNGIYFIVGCVLIVIVQVLSASYGIFGGGFYGNSTPYVDPYEYFDT